MTWTDALLLNKAVSRGDDGAVHSVPGLDLVIAAILKDHPVWLISRIRVQTWFD